MEELINHINFFIKYSAVFLGGFRTTLLLSLIAGLFSIFFGTILALMKMNKKLFPLRWFANGYVEFVRGLPVLVQISMVFYGLPLLGIEFPPVVVFGYDFGRLGAGIIALTINSSAYICEIIRSGIQSIDSGQSEASWSLGFGYFHTMKLVVLPQAVKNILPALANEFTNLIKASSQVSVIGVAELMFSADTVRGISYQPFIPLVIIAILYFTLTFTTSLISRTLEKHFKKSDR